MMVGVCVCFKMVAVFLSLSVLYRFHWSFTELLHALSFQCAIQLISIFEDGTGVLSNM